MCEQLILIPTHFERQQLPLDRGRLAKSAIEVCGVGAVVAGVRTARLLAHYQPSSVLLLGIAGAIGSALQVGSAYEFDSVACYGIGVGCGSNYSTLAELGWEDWLNPSLGPDEEPLAEVLSLKGDQQDKPTQGTARQLLTAMAASACPQDVAWRSEKFPDAAAEDMEGYAVATACHMARVPLRIIRGISNAAGDRQHERWRVAQALQAAAELAGQV